MDKQINILYDAIGILNWLFTQQISFSGGLIRPVYYILVSTDPTQINQLTELNQKLH